MNEQQYLVSVVTPFHNTDMGLFKKGFMSLKKQTLGFDRIEWIVVVHNSEEHYLDEARQITKGCENVKILELNNNIRTPSSPRNYALDRCTGKYVAFLDSDDTFNLDAFQEITDALEESGADLACFRGEKEIEDDTIIALLDIRATFDQTQHMIELKRDDPRMNDLIHEGSMTVWSKMIRRQLLEDHHIRFDENITIGEDVKFSITCFSKVERLIILPQTIGYVYYMHHGSLAQTGSYSTDGLVSVAKGFADQFDVALEGGFRIERLAWPIMGFLAQLIQMSPEMPDEAKETIRNTMKRYLVNMTDMPTDPKFFPPDVAAGLMANVRRVILGENQDAVETPAEESGLMPILRENAACELGQKYGFEGIRSLEEYQDRVPIVDYSFYGPLVKLSTRIGESNLFTCGKVAGYFGDFGSMQNPQLYPYTQSDFMHYAGILASQLNETPESTMLLLSTTPKKKKLHYKDDTYLDSVYGAVARSLRDADVFTSYQRRFKYGCVTSPEALVFPSRSFDQRYGRLLFALADPDVTQIIASNTWALLDLFRYLEKNWGKIVDDLEKGEISEKSGLGEEVRMTLGAKLKKQPERAKELRAIFAEGFDSPIIPRIWKRMERIIANAFGDFTFYTEQLRAYSGQLPIDHGYEMLPETVLARSVAPESEELVLCGNAFLELRPVGEQKERPILPRDAVPGERYEVIVTNHSGLYRCATGLVLEARELKDGSVGFVYVSRKEEIVEANGLLLNAGKLAPAVNRLGKTMGMNFADYSTAAGKDGKLAIYLELTDEKAIEKTRTVTTDSLAKLMEMELWKIPDLEYAAHRKRHIRVPVEIYFVQPETQLFLRDSRMSALDANADQMRPVRALLNPKHQALYRAQRL